MVRVAKDRTSLERGDRRRMRLIQAVLAFPAAGMIGFGGHLAVRSAVGHVPAISTPQHPAEHRDQAKPHHTRGAESPEDSRRPRNA